MDSKMMEELIKIKTEVLKKKDEKEAFYKDVDVYTKYFRLEIYNCFGNHYEETILGEEHYNNQDSNYYYANLVLYYPIYVKNEFKDPFKINEDFIELARKKNDKDWKNTPYYFLLNNRDYSLHPINCIKLYELLENDKKEFNIDLDYSQTDNEFETRYIKAKINKEDFARLISQAENKLRSRIK